MICLTLTVFFICKVICNKRFFGFFLVILGADQKDRSVWERDCPRSVLKNLLKHVRVFQIELESGSVGFLRERKTGVPGEKPLGARERINKNK